MHAFITEIIFHILVLSYIKNQRSSHTCDLCDKVSLFRLWMLVVNVIMALSAADMIRGCLKNENVWGAFYVVDPEYV